MGKIQTVSKYMKWEISGFFPRSNHIYLLASSMVPAAGFERWSTRSFLFGWFYSFYIYWWQKYSYSYIVFAKLFLPMHVWVCIFIHFNCYVIDYWKDVISFM